MNAKGLGWDVNSFGGQEVNHCTSIQFKQCLPHIIYMIAKASNITYPNIHGLQSIH